VPIVLDAQKAVPKVVVTTEHSIPFHFAPYTLPSKTDRRRMKLEALPFLLLFLLMLPSFPFAHYVCVHVRVCVYLCLFVVFGFGTCPLFSHFFFHLALAFGHDSHCALAAYSVAKAFALDG